MQKDDLPNISLSYTSIFEYMFKLFMFLCNYICFVDPKKAGLFNNGYHYPPHLTPIPFMPMAHPAMMSMAMAGHLGMRQESMPFHQEKEYQAHK